MSDNKNKTDKDFPGYPHYPANEDIMNKGERVDADDESISRANKHKAKDLKDRIAEDKSTLTDNTNDDELIVSGTDADVTSEDLATLSSEGTGIEEGAIDEFDVPGSEDDDANEEIGEEDEENNYYSLGGDEKD